MRRCKQLAHSIEPDLEGGPSFKEKVLPETVEAFKEMLSKKVVYYTREKLSDESNWADMQALADTIRRAGHKALRKGYEPLLVKVSPAIETKLLELREQKKCNWLHITEFLTKFYMSARKRYDMRLDLLQFWNQNMFCVAVVKEGYGRFLPKATLAAYTDSEMYYLSRLMYKTWIGYEDKRDRLNLYTDSIKKGGKYAKELHEQQRRDYPNELITLKDAESLMGPWLYDIYKAVQPYYFKEGNREPLLNMLSLLPYRALIEGMPDW